VIFSRLKALSTGNDCNSGRRWEWEAEDEWEMIIYLCNVDAPTDVFEIYEIDR